MPDWGRRRDDIAQHVGIEQVRRLGTITAAQLRRFDVAAGRATGAGSDARPAHPLFLSSVLGWEAGPDEAGLRADGSGPADLAGVPVDGLRLMGAGQAVEVVRPLAPDTSVELRTRLDAVELKEGRSGEFLLMTFLRRYLDQTGAELLRCTETFIAR